MATHTSLQMFRSFSVLRTRLLLLTQNRIARLEKELEKIDREEPKPLSLACSRMDGNLDRESVLSSIKAGIAEYGKSASRVRAKIALGF